VSRTVSLRQQHKRRKLARRWRLIPTWWGFSVTWLFGFPVVASGSSLHIRPYRSSLTLQQFNTLDWLEFRQNICNHFVTMWSFRGLRLWEESIFSDHGDGASPHDGTGHDTDRIGLALRRVPTTSFSMTSWLLR